MHRVKGDVTSISTALSASVSSSVRVVLWRHEGARGFHGVNGKLVDNFSHEYDVLSVTEVMY